MALDHGEMRYFGKNAVSGLGQFAGREIGRCKDICRITPPGMIWATQIVYDLGQERGLFTKLRVDARQIGAFEVETTDERLYIYHLATRQGKSGVFAKKYPTNVERDLLIDIAEIHPPRFIHVVWGNWHCVVNSRDSPNPGKERVILPTQAYKLRSSASLIAGYMSNLGATGDSS